MGAPGCSPQARALPEPPTSAHFEHWAGSFPQTYLWCPPRSVLTWVRGSSPHLFIPKGKGCAFSGQFSLPPRGSPDCAPAGHELCLENSGLSVLSAERRMSFLQMESRTLCFPVCFLLRTAYDFCYGEPSLLEGLPPAGDWTGGCKQTGSAGAALAGPAGTGFLILLQCAFPLGPVGAVSVGAISCLIFLPASDTWDRGTFRC